MDIEGVQNNLTKNYLLFEKITQKWRLLQKIKHVPLWDFNYALPTSLWPSKWKRSKRQSFFQQIFNFKLTLTYLFISIAYIQKH